MQELEAVVRRLKESNRLEPTPDPRGDEPPIFTEAERPRLAAVEPEPTPVRVPEAAPVAKAPEAAPVASADHDGPAEAPVEPRRRLFADLPAVPVLRTGGGGGGGGEGPPDDPMDDFDDEDEGGFGPFATWIAAAAAIALVIGVSVWTYKLGQRDAMDVPIVRAIEGPSRVSPTDPGGTQMAHQGLSVNDVLEGGGVRSVADSVTTAPGDAGLREEDRAQLELASLSEARRPTARPSIRRPAVASNEERVALAMEDVLDYALDNAGQGAARLPQIGRDETASTEPVATPQASEPTEEVAAAPASEIKFERPTVAATAPAEDVDGDTVREILLAMKQEEAASPLADAAEAGAEVLANVTGTEINTLPVQDAAPTDDTPVATETVAEIVPEPAPVTAPKPVAEDVTASAEAVAEKLQASAEAQLVLAGLPVPPAGEGSIYAPARGIKPAQRPVRLAALATTSDVPSAAGTVTDATQPTITAAAAPAPAPSADNLDVIPLPAGTRMIQIGAYGSEAIARQQWDRFSSLHGDVLGGKEHYVQRTNNSGKIFYRLRVAGYATKDESRGACDALAARGLPCITVTLR